METVIITTIITSVCTLLGVIITVVTGNKKQKAEMALTQQQQKQEIKEIKAQLKEHNNYAIAIPVIQKELEYIRGTLTELKQGR